MKNLLFFCIPALSDKKDHAIEETNEVIANMKDNDHGLVFYVV